jgi:DNA-binding transcriptional MerR regulator
VADASGKSEQAFRTIGELASDLGVPQHILRYWETRFPQLKPLQRAGNRRYYRAADVQLAHRIYRLLNQDGYTIRGVQQLLQSGAADGRESSAPAEPAPPRAANESGALSVEALRAIRQTLVEALEATAA